MNSKKFTEAMSELDTKYVDEALNYKKKAKKPVWVKWSGLVACLCLIVVCAFTVNNLLSWRSGCGQISHNITLNGDNMYYHRNNSGVYLYEMETMKNKKLADFDGIFTQTKSGLYLLNEETGGIYSVDGSQLNKIGNISPYSVLIDVIGNNVFYRTYSDEGIYTIEMIDFTTGDIMEILSVSGCHLKAQIILDEKLYYYTTDRGGMISMFDLKTGASEVVYNSSMDDVAFYQDFILIETEQGLFCLDYNDRQTKFISEYKPTTAALDYFNNKLYFVAAFEMGVEEYEEALVSIDVQTKEMIVVTRLTEGGMTITYTELCVCNNGYFYTNPSASTGGLFYHSFDGTEEITISSKR